MKYILLFLIVCVSFSCRTPKNTASELTHETNVDVQKDVQTDENARLTELTYKIIERLLNERLQVSAKAVKYDTEKPADPTTGKHPVMEESEIIVNRETNTQETINDMQAKDSVWSMKKYDRSVFSSKCNGKLKIIEKVGLNGFQKVMFCLPFALMIALCLFLLIKKIR